MTDKDRYSKMGWNEGDPLPGDVCVIINLEGAAAKYNDCVGEVLLYDGDKNRYEIRLNGRDGKQDAEENGDVKKVKGKNLRPARVEERSLERVAGAGEGEGGDEGEEVRATVASSAVVDSTEIYTDVVAGGSGEE